MPLLAAELQANIDAAKARLVTLSLHTADPGTTGANEATGGSPAYARKAITWGATDASGDTVGTEVVFDAPAGTYTHAGYWSGDATPVFRGSSALSPNQTLGAQGQVKVTPTLDGSTT